MAPAGLSDLAGEWQRGLTPTEDLWGPESPDGVCNSNTKDIVLQKGGSLLGRYGLPSLRSSTSPSNEAAPGETKHPLCFSSLPYPREELQRLNHILYPPPQAPRS